RHVLLARQRVDQQQHFPAHFRLSWNFSFGTSRARSISSSTNTSLRPAAPAPSACDDCCAFVAFPAFVALPGAPFAPGFDPAFLPFAPAASGGRSTSSRP